MRRQLGWVNGRAFATLHNEFFIGIPAHMEYAARQAMRRGCQFKMCLKLWTALFTISPRANPPTLACSTNTYHCASRLTPYSPQQRALPQHLVRALAELRPPSTSLPLTLPRLELLMRPAAGRWLTLPPAALHVVSLLATSLKHFICICICEELLLVTF